MTAISNKRTKILFVCMGNICRSPLAHGLFQKLANDSRLEAMFEVDSAGTHAYHVGEPPDTRSQDAAFRRGIDLSGQRARKVTNADYEHYDYLIAMDRDYLDVLLRSCPPEHTGKLRLFLDFAPHLNEHEVPDPYYGGESGFERVFDLVEEAAIGLLKDLREELD